jgi:hypothetical protein
VQLQSLPRFEKKPVGCEILGYESLEKKYCGASPNSKNSDDSCSFSVFDRILIEKGEKRQRLDSAIQLIHGGECLEN